MAAIHKVIFNPENLWDDLQALNIATKDTQKYQLCTYKGKLSSSYFIRDIQAKETSLKGWGKSLVGAIAAKVSSTVTSTDYNDMSVFDYLSQIVTYIETNKQTFIDTPLSDGQRELIDSFPHSLFNVAGEHSKMFDLDIHKGRIDSTHRGIASGYVEIAKRVEKIIEELPKVEETKK